MEDLTPEMTQALWDGDVEKLGRLAPCQCCCDEHTYENCAARQWFGCRGQSAMTQADEESWIRHYSTVHGMSREQFFDFVTDKGINP